MRGFIYVVTTVGKDYQQSDWQRDVPTIWEDRLVFGPCKVNMRPKMNRGDYVFGISPSGVGIRRIVFAAKIGEVLTFEEASRKYQDDWTANGITPICVKPVGENGRIGMFPVSHYDHLEGAKHLHSWKKDIPTRQHDRCFICKPISKSPWLGKSGPVTSGKILDFLRQCELSGATIQNQVNSWASESQPIVYRRNESSGFLFTGLHLETDAPERLVELVLESVEDGLSEALRPIKLRLSATRRNASVRCR